MVQRTGTTSTPKLLEMPASGLLAEFGRGRPTPGSGSASALNGVLACEMIATTAKITLKHSNSQRVRSECEYVIKLINQSKPKLEKLIQKDSDVFQDYISADSNARKITGNEKRKSRERARRRLREATELLKRISRQCVAVARLGLVMMDIGFEPARGDPAVGVSNALAGAIGSFSAAMMNVKLAKRTNWAAAAMVDFQETYIEFLEVQSELVAKVTGLKREAEDSLEVQMKLL